MAWRFRRSVKLLPGVRLNVGKRSAGVSVGPRGAKVSVNTKREVRRTVSLPGTGLSHTTQTKLAGAGDADDVQLEELTADELMYAKRRRLRKLVGLGSVAVLVVLIVAGAPSLPATSSSPRCS